MEGSDLVLMNIVMFAVLFEGITVTQGTIDEQKYSTECRLSVGGHRYAGSISRTISGFTCQSWSAKEPHYQTFMNDVSAFPGGNLAASSNYCRNPDTAWHGGVWCYTTNHTVRWEHCDVDVCECKVSTTGAEYGGRQNVTATGRPCQSWDSQTPHSHQYSHGDQFIPDVYVSDASNYCRNPGGENVSRPDAPWCYTTIEAVEWEYCNIDQCGFQLITVNPPATTVATTTITTATTTTTPTPTTTKRETTRTTRRPTTRRPTTASTATQRSSSTPDSTTATTKTSLKTPSEKPAKDKDAGGDTAASTSGRSSTTIIIASVVTVVVVVVLGAVMGVVLYKRVCKNLIPQGTKEKLEESFDNPSFNVEKNDVDIPHM